MKMPTRNPGPKHLIGLLCLGLLLFSTSSIAQTAAPDGGVPAALSPANGDRLRAWKHTLDQRRAEINQKVNDFNSRCASV
ncbi:MAG: hypothetical protein V1782_04840, partial [Pseudomonadota bacterium]